MRIFHKRNLLLFTLANKWTLLCNKYCSTRIFVYVVGNFHGMYGLVQRGVKFRGFCGGVQILPSQAHNY